MGLRGRLLRALPDDLPCHAGNDPARRAHCDRVFGGRSAGEIPPAAGLDGHARHGPGLPHGRLDHRGRDLATVCPGHRDGPGLCGAQMVGIDFRALRSAEQRDLFLSPAYSRRRPSHARTRPSHDLVDGHLRRNHAPSVSDGARNAAVRGVPRHERDRRARPVRAGWFRIVRKQHLHDGHDQCPGRGSALHRHGRDHVPIGGDGGAVRLVGSIGRPISRAPIRRLHPAVGDPWCPFRRSHGGCRPAGAFSFSGYAGARIRYPVLGRNGAGGREPRSDHPAECVGDPGRHHCGRIDRKDADCRDHPGAGVDGDVSRLRRRPRLFPTEPGAGHCRRCRAGEAAAGLPPA